jgi:hypothetical protein
VIPTLRTRQQVLSLTRAQRATAAIATALAPDHLADVERDPTLTLPAPAALLLDEDVTAHRVHVLPLQPKREMRQHRPAEVAMTLHLQGDANHHHRAKGMIPLLLAAE